MPNISKWNIINVTNISGIFYECLSIKTLPDISNWDTSNVLDMSDLFYKCSSLRVLPDISKWNISNVKNMSGMFVECSSLEFQPDFSYFFINKNNESIDDELFSLIDPSINISKFLNINNCTTFFAPTLEFILMKYFLDALI